MKILIANPPCRIDIGSGRERYFVRSGSRWPFSVVKRREEPAEYMPFPFYLAYSAALLLQEGHQVSVIDAVALNLTREDFLKECRRIGPDLIMFETATPTIEHDLRLVRELKEETRALIVLAGTHVTVFPREIMETARQVDFILSGEYELNFLRLVRALEGDRQLEKLDGIAFRSNGGININSRRVPVDLEQLPFPARELFPADGRNDLNLYWDAFCQIRPAVQMHSSRGCPVQCNFCLWNQVIYGSGRYRTFSAKRVVDEMEHCARRFSAREIYFDDDSFTVDKKHVLDLCREIAQRRLCLNWSAMADAMFLDEEMLEAMSAAGCIGIKFGVESGNKGVLRRIGKPIDFARVKRVAGYCARKKIKTHATFTFGLSGEDLSTVQDTLAFSRELDVDSVQFSITTPFPGTRYYRELKEQDRIITENWSAYDGACSSVVRFESFSREDLERICSSASSMWLRDKIRKPGWLARQLFNMARLIRGQGPVSFIKKVARGLRLVRGG